MCLLYEYARDSVRYKICTYYMYIERNAMKHHIICTYYMYISAIHESIRDASRNRNETTRKKSHNFACST